jgi:beta-phosphoglucomutase-like phosphatase (HAD superfamily)
MAKKLISDLSAFDLYIFDLDNTIYNEEDYLLQAYAAICDRFGNKADSPDKEDLLKILLDIYRKEGTGKMFDKFLKIDGLIKFLLSNALKY